MKWTEVEKKYGKKLANKMAKSKFLQGITVTMNKDGTTDIPELDIYLAYKDVTGKPIHPFEWD